MREVVKGLTILGRSHTVLQHGQVLPYHQPSLRRSPGAGRFYACRFCAGALGQRPILRNHRFQRQHEI